MNRVFSAISRNPLKLVWRNLCSPPSNTEAEQNLLSILKRKFPKATDLSVNDMSGGCGAMYEVNIISEDFKGIRPVQQHRLVTEVESYLYILKKVNCSKNVPIAGPERRN